MLLRRIARTPKFSLQDLSKDNHIKSCKVCRKNGFSYDFFDEDIGWEHFDNNIYNYKSILDTESAQNEPVLNQSDNELIFISYAKEDRLYVDAIATEAQKYEGVDICAVHNPPLIVKTTSSI